MNRGTAELIRARCEREVRSGVLRWSGLPVGGTGALAFLATVLVWIPQQIQDADLGRVAHEALRYYVETAVTRQADFQAQLEAVVREAAALSAGREVTSRIQAASRERVGEALAVEIGRAASRGIADALRSPDTQRQLEGAVAEVLEPGEYRLLREAIVNTTRRRLLETIEHNAAQAVETVANPLPEDQIVNKSTYQALRRYLRAVDPAAPPKGELALRFYLAAESGEEHRYDEHVIRQYLVDLEGVFGDRFRHALILDRRGRYVGLSDVDAFRQVVERSGSRLTSILNDKRLSLAQAETRLRDLLGEESVLYLDAGMSIKQALHAQALHGVERRVAVVEDGAASRRFMGVTTRRRLLEALLR